MTGTQIKAIRLNLGLTQEEFGKLLNASKGNVSTWEHGKSLPNPKRLKQIADFAGITVEALIGLGD